MLTETITLQIEAEACAILQRRAQTDKVKLQALFEASLRQNAESDAASLKETVEMIGRDAQRRGLTPEILDEEAHQPEQNT